MEQLNQMGSLIKELNQYFVKNDNLVSAEQGLVESGAGNWGIYAFVYLDEEGDLTNNRLDSEESFYVELSYLDSEDEDCWNKLNFDLEDPDWVEALEKLASKIVDHRS